MATDTQVGRGLRRIEDKIDIRRSDLIKAANNFQSISNDLNAIATDEQAVVNAIAAYGDTDPAEINAKALLAKYTAEFLDLKAKADAAVTALSAIDFTT